MFKIYTTKTQKASKHIKVVRDHWPKSSWRKQYNVQKTTKMINIYFKDHICDEITSDLENNCSFSTNMYFIIVKYK